MDRVGGLSGLTNPELWLDQHGDYLFRCALRYGVSRELAEDMVQETFLAGIRGLPQFQGNSSVRTWLASILRNRLFDHFRKQSRAPVQELDVEDYFRSDGHFRPEMAKVCPEKHCLFRDLMKLVLACLGELSDRSKQIFLLAEFEEISPSELASSFELSPENVRVILHRARLKLRGCVLKGGVQL